MEGKGKPCSEIYNIAHKLQRHEIGNKLDLRNAHSQIKFRNFQLQAEFDTCHQSRSQTSMIVKVVTARSIVFALAQSGLCAAFDRDTNERLCYLNLSPHELIRSLFYNKISNSLITISVYDWNRFSMKCRTTPLEYIRRAQPDAGFTFFESEKLSWPSFVAFDDINDKLLTFSAQDHICKVFDLKNYKLLFSFSDKKLEGIKITPGIMLLISKRSASGSILPLKNLSIEDGTVLKSINHALLRNKKIDFVELFNDKILLKQKNECLQIVDVQNEKKIELSKQEFKKPSTFIFLYGKRLFLSFYGGSVIVWNLQGELVASYRDHLLRLPECNRSILHLTHDEEMVLSYNKIYKYHESDKTNGSINISNILTGNFCATIGGNDPDVGISCRNRHNATLIKSTVQDALEDITALFYDEERHEIYTGNTRGFVHVWSN